MYNINTILILTKTRDEITGGGKSLFAEKRKLIDYKKNREKSRYGN
jgi:hypothetical protein